MSGGSTGYAARSLALAALLSAGCRVADPPQAESPQAGAVLWLSADTSVSFGDDERLTGWADLSGYEHDAEVITWPPGIAKTADPPDRSPRLARSPVASGTESEEPKFVTFDGSDDLLGIVDAEPLNLGGPYGQRTVFLVFRTGDDVQRRQMLFETGGDLRGFNAYLYEGQLYLGAFNVWNDDRGQTTPFGPAHVTAVIAARTTYVATLQFDHPGGALTGYLNGAESGRETAIGRVFEHHEDTGIGGINEDTYYHDGQRQAVPSADHFGGGIGAILVYNSVLPGAERESTERWLMRRFGAVAVELETASLVWSVQAGGYALGAMYVGR